MYLMYNVMLTNVVMNESNITKRLLIKIIKILRLLSEKEYNSPNSFMSLTA